jgi:YD repeat-containing protein
MGNMTSRSLGTPPPDADPNNPLSTRGRAAVKAVSGTVDTLAFAYQSTTPKIATVTTSGLDHTVAYDAAGNETSTTPPAPTRRATSSRA